MKGRELLSNRKKIFVAGFTRFKSYLKTIMHSIIDILTSRYTVLINDFDRDNSFRHHFLHYYLNLLGPLSLNNFFNFNTKHS